MSISFTMRLSIQTPFVLKYYADVLRLEMCGIMPLRPGLGGEAGATAREHAARRDARLQPF